MKKATKPSTRPAAKPTPVPAKKKVAVKPVAAAKPVAVAKPKVAKAPVVRAKAKPVLRPEVKDVQPSASKTTITAMIDVGFGNTLYIRGEGPGLSWETGVAIDCLEDEKWSYVISDASTPVVFKFLLNDLTWCAGEDFVVAPGGTIELSPEF